MTFAELDIQQFYTPPKDDVVNDFFIPVLRNSISYDRAVAFFSSTALYEMTVGIAGLIHNGGHMRYIISPENLSAEDVSAIHKGYEERERCLSQLLLPAFTQPKNYFERERLNLLAYLLETSRMDIKIAIPKNTSGHGLFHDKSGVMTDSLGFKIGFIGSFNDTSSAIHYNNERIGTYTSMHNDQQAIEQLEHDFNLLWENRYEYDEVIPFPEDVKAAIQAYRKPTFIVDIDQQEFASKHLLVKPLKPNSVHLYTYQEKAVLNWENNNYCGVFNMATGSGKTWTALYGLTKLIQKERVAVIICCPYQHLVDQWAQDLREWSFNYISGYTNSPTKNWKQKLSKQIQELNREVTEYLCLITTNASFRTKWFQEQIKSISVPIVLVVDEAHNFGAPNLAKLLTDRFKYRLGLSATIERYNDEIGTQALRSFFGDDCINYGLQDAIDNHQLTRYYYYPVLVHLTPDELQKYNEISEEISREVRFDPKTNSFICTKKGEMLRIKRARLIAGASNKLNVLKQKLIEAGSDDDHVLVYCGATTVNDIDFDDDLVNEEELRQIDAVTRMLHFDIGMRVSRFTSRETAEQRMQILQSFDEGDIQVLAAIKCLDEGVSVKSIKKAYILASSTNPREYIQRRGRVLRLYPGKQYAYIYDFITLPRPLSTVADAQDNEFDLQLIKREIGRAIEFARNAENRSDTDIQKDKILEAYGVESLEEFGGVENYE